MPNPEDEEKKDANPAEGDKPANRSSGENDAPKSPDAGEKPEGPLESEEKPSGQTSAKGSFHFQHPIDELYDAQAADHQEPDENETGENETGQEEIAFRRQRKWPRRLLYAVVLVLVSILLALIIISFFADRYGLGKPDKKIDVTIPRGATTETIAGVLKKDGVISNTLGFRLFVKQNKLGGFQSGVYTLNPSQGYEEIVDTLRDPDQNKNSVSVTIPEGQTLRQIADILNQKGVCTQQDFLNALDEGGFTFSYGAQIPNDSNRYYKYEGYLFPDTYTLLKNSSGKTAAQKMLSNFSSKFTASMAAKAKQQGMSIDQIITLASITQKEAASQSVMADVSSVFYNRLREGVNGKKLLQSDATVLYAKHDLTAALNSSDAALDSHYNTYRYEGLPPGPICNPGMDAINAALNPNSTSYLYFVSDANDQYYFASTFADHVKNVKKAAKVGTTQATGDLSSSQ